MKTFKILTYTMLVLLLVLSSCVNDNKKISKITSDNGLVTMAIVAERDQLIKTNKSLKLFSTQWEVGDKLVVMDKEAEYIEFTFEKALSFSKGLFVYTGKIPPTWIDGYTTLKAYYKNKNFHKSSTYEYWQFVYQNDYLSQTQESNGSSSHLSDFGVMISDEFIFSEENTHSLSLSDIGLLMTLHLDGLDGETIKSIELKSDSKKSFVSSVIVKNDYSYVVNETDRIELLFGEQGVFLDEGESLTAYMMLGDDDKNQIVSFFDKPIFIYAYSASGDVYEASFMGKQPNRGVCLVEKTMQKKTFWSSGNGTINNPYRIYTPNDLQLINDYIGLNYSTKGLYFRLENDMNFAEYGYGEGQNSWLPIAYNWETPFEGHIDGNGKSIFGLYSRAEDDSFAALFGHVGESASLIDLSVDVDASGSGDITGLVYCNKGIISGCKVSGIVNSTRFSNAGGVAVYNMGSIIGCSNHARIKSNSVFGQSLVGGICVFNEGKVIACYNTAEQSSLTTSNDDHHALHGGIVGVIYSCAEGVEVTGCYNSLDLNTEVLQRGTIIGATEGYVDFKVTSVFWGGRQKMLGYDEGGICKIVGRVGRASNPKEWSTAMLQMNEAIKNSGWKYVQNDGEDKDICPLILSKID